MPPAPRKPCRHPSCGILGLATYCEKHTKVKVEEVKLKDKYRGTSASRGYDYRWSKYSKQYRLNNPLCVLCEKKGILKLAQCVDHIKPVVDGQNDPLFWEPSNHRSLCNVCHSTVTALQDGGYGNAKKG